jgi:hypothetical protein
LIFITYVSNVRRTATCWLAHARSPTIPGALDALIAAGTPVRLTLTATTEPFVSRNVLGLIPGRTDELVILNSHTGPTR